MSGAIDITGRRFGRTVAIERVSRPGDVWYRCQCDCGVSHESRSSSLRSGSTNSCGCIRRERLRTHGQSKTTAEYFIWKSMRQRCKPVGGHRNYGARGIRVCERWTDFEIFIQDMGSRPSVSHTLERRDNDGPYSPENCVWATRVVQAQNTRRSIVEFRGRKQSRKQWAKELGICYFTLRWRLRNGWTAERALTEGIECQNRADQKRAGR